MRYSAHIAFQELPTAPVGQIGSWGNQLSLLIRLGIPVAAGFVVPARTLWQIAEANQLQAKLAQAGQPAAQRKIFNSLHIPTPIASDLLRAIQTELLDQKTIITGSWIQKTTPTPHLSQTAMGDASILETLLELWADAYLQQTAPQPSLVPLSFVLQVALESNLIGHTITRDEDVPKNTLALYCNHHSTPLIFDVRTWNIVSGRDLTMFNQVNETVWLQLAQYLHRIRLLSLHNYRISWQIYQQQPLITYVSPVEAPMTTSARPLAVYSLTAVSGRPAIPGKVRGKVVNQVSQIVPQSILVVPQLESLPLSLVRILAAVVVDAHIGQAALAQLQQYHIPVIINTRNASGRFKPGQTVLVDATKGVISLLNPSDRPLTTKRSQPLYVAVNQPLTEEHTLPGAVQGSMFRPELTLANQGIHPLHLIRSQHNKTLFKDLTSSLASYRSLNLPFLYRISTFTSDQLRHLEHGGMYEPEETNPRLGFFGGLRHISTPEILDFELSALTRIAPTFSQPPGVVVAGCRTIPELKYVSHHILTTAPACKGNIWWELDTPEHIFTISAENLTSCHGLVINAHSLHALSLGIDPTNQDVYHRYSWNEPLMNEWLKRVKEIAAEKPVMLYMMEDQPHIFRLVHALQLSGLIVKSTYAQVASSYLETHV